MNIDWKNLFKIRIANPDESFAKHEVVKLLIVMKILNKHRRRNWIRIYTEHKLNGMTPDIYFENLKTKEVICYEIQKKITKAWTEEKTKQYNNYDVPFFKSIDLIIVPIEKLSNDLEKLNKELEEYIF